MKIVILPCILMLLSACVASRLATPQQTDVSRGAALFPKLTLQDLNEGKEIFETNCNRCHPLKDPEKHSVEEWNTIVPRMVMNVNRKTDSTTINAIQQQQLLEYIITMGLASGD